MKLFTIVVNITLLFSFSMSSQNLLIIVYPRLNESYNLQEENWEDPFSSMENSVREELCDRINEAKLLLASRSENEEASDQFYVRNRIRNLLPIQVNYPQIHESMQLIVVNKEMTATTISCVFKNSTIYLAKHKNCEHYLLFGADDFPDIPKLMAVLVPHLKLRKLITNKNNLENIFSYEIYSKYEREVLTETANSIFSRKGIENFQLCASLLSFLAPIMYSSITKYFLLIHGHDHNQSKKLLLNYIHPKTNNYPYVLSLYCQAFDLNNNEIIDKILLSYNVVPHPLNEYLFFIQIDYQIKLKCVQVILNAEN